MGQVKNYGELIMVCLLLGIRGGARVSGEHEIVKSCVANDRNSWVILIDSVGPCSCNMFSKKVTARPTWAMVSSLDSILFVTLQSVYPSFYEKVVSLISN
ncbi:unnamed protein product [Dovyalis caffra]|uniref:Uncharacterized protein n=1 Tax=Dovyalis caffra TaxID=77055 RepID=A0AAV1R408_9ROSI|nr:unnamed protein product [Dovyalis caffra]